MNCDHKQLIKLYFRGVPDSKISVRPDRIVEESRIRLDRTLSSNVIDEELFSELGNEHDEKQIKRLLQNIETTFKMPEIRDYCREMGQK